MGNQQQIIAEEFQAESHSMAMQAISASSKSITPQDATNAYLYFKLAEMELRLRELEAKLLVRTEIKKEDA